MPAWPRTSRFAKALKAAETADQRLSVVEQSAAIETDDDDAFTYVEDLLARGVTAESIFLNLRDFAAPV